MEEFPKLEVLEPIMVKLNQAIAENNHEAIIDLFNSNIEGYHNAS
jgi:hypothetical protein